jgi:hypothetical protein
LVAAAVTESDEAADAVLDDAAPADAAGAPDDELPLLQPATAASPAVAATQAMRQRVPDRCLLRAGMFIPPPSRGPPLFLLMGLCLSCGIYRRIRRVRK